METPGLLSGRPHRFRWPGEGLPTVHVSRVHGDPASDGADPARPTTLAQASRQLVRPGAVLPAGLRVLLLAGETWTLEDLQRNEPGDALLIIRSCGAPGRPIVIGAYRHPLAGSEAPPALLGDGAPGRRPRSTGIRIDGARWVQIQDLQIRNFSRGVSVTSFAAPGGPSPEAPLRGPRDVNLVDLEICENWEDGIAINARYAMAAGRMLGRRDRPQVLVGDGTLEAADGDRLVPIPIDPEGWWPERINIESCVVEANGDGTRSSGVNISLSGLASLCTIRHNRVRGRRHSLGWRNQPGRYLAGDEALPAGAVLDEQVWADPADWTRWGVDGLTSTGGGCGNVIEHNVFSDHVHAQSGVPPFSCRRDDGNGIDLKHVGNRQYWEDDGRGGRRLASLPSAIRHNLIADNRGPAIVLHFGCRGLAIENNRITGNRGADGSALSIQAGRALNGGWRSEHSAGRGAGPALVCDVAVLDNLIDRNPGGNAVVVRGSKQGWDGSFRGLRFCGNQVTGNAGHGLVLRVQGVADHADSAVSEATGFEVRGNLFADNDGPTQVRIVAPADPGALALGDNTYRGPAVWIAGAVRSGSDPAV